MRILSRPDIKVSLRPAIGTDIHALSRLIRRYYAFDHISFDAKTIRSGLKALLQNKSAGQAFLIALESKPIGYTILTYGFDLEFAGRTALMTDLYLEPGYRNLGIGGMTMRFLEQFCHKKQIKTLELQVERDNAAAMSFYQRHGFTAHNRIPMSKRLRQR